jgi:hypothetical protein
VLCCAVLYCAMLYCTVLYCTTLLPLSLRTPSPLYFLSDYYFYLSYPFFLSFVFFLSTLPSRTYVFKMKYEVEIEREVEIEIEKCIPSALKSTTETTMIVLAIKTINNQFLFPLFFFFSFYFILFSFHSICEEGTVRQYETTYLSFSIAVLCYKTITSLYTIFHCLFF